MKIIIAYKTRLGASKEYAEWLAQAMGTSAKTFEEVTAEELRACEACAVISGTYAGQMPLRAFLKQHWTILRDKKVAALAVGGVSPELKWSKFSYWLLPRKIKKQIRYWKLPGRLEGGQAVEWGEMKKENLAEAIQYLQ